MLISCALMLAPAMAARGAEVRITVAADKPAWTISKLLTGMHTVYGHEPDALWENPQVIQWLKQAKVGTIRYPGGTAVQTWHWDNPSGISFESDSWDPHYKDTPRDPDLWMDLGEYIALCRKIGAEPMVGINTGSGLKFKRQRDSLQSARRLIQHCVAKGYGVKLWYIGNECYKGWSAESYAKAIDEYAAVLKRVDPNITIIGDWKFGPETAHRFDQAVQIALRSKHLDVLEIHEKYVLEKRFGLTKDGYSSTSAKGWQSEAGLYHGRLDFYIEKFYAEMAKHRRSVKLAFNEWAATNETPYLTALTKADYLISMFKHPIFSACDWTTSRHEGAPILFDFKTNTLKGLGPAAAVYAMFAQAMGGRHLPMTSSAQNVYGFAARCGEQDVQVYLLNKRSEAVDARIDLSGIPSRLLHVETESFVEPGKIVKAPPRDVESPAALKIPLPPLSFNRIVLAPPAPAPKEVKKP
ncbi:MAG: hypothetical protein ABFD85_07200 [Phycisphaerae bacterium]